MTASLLTHHQNKDVLWYKDVQRVIMFILNLDIFPNFL